MTLPRRFGRFRPDGNFWTIPNALSVTRALLAVPVAWLILADGPLRWVFSLLAIMIASDWLDGWIARWTNKVSSWGKVLDPLADKAAGAAIAAALALRGMLPAWFLLALVARDALILLGSGLLAHRTGRVEMSARSGKVATGAVAVTLLAALLRADEPVMRFCLFATAALLAGSFVEYAIRYARRTKQGESFSETESVAAPPAREDPDRTE